QRGAADAERLRDLGLDEPLIGHVDTVGDRVLEPLIGVLELAARARVGVPTLLCQRTIAYRPGARSALYHGLSVPPGSSSWNLTLSSHRRWVKTRWLNPASGGQLRRRWAAGRGTPTAPERDDRPATGGAPGR